MKERKMNNKGFSLVELIIVIAIMAILVVVLAPQYLKYVEKSRVSSDAQTAVEFESAMSVLASDPDITLDSGKTYSVTSVSSGAITISDDLKAAFTTAGSIDPTKTYKYTSTTFKNATGGDGGKATSIILKYDTAAKVWKVEKKGIPDTNASS
ncbi:MAG: prepilin-type N-terminal cleavage/methylation domain-containing protein [Lachnospiraceae bacterium]|nr:prepilin-type N-terminal cleavage/methylation domain-containing protein [Lachnospiraceae bacterium]